MHNSDVFRALEVAGKLLLSFAANSEIRLVNIDFVVPFVEDDKKISVWLFYKKDEDIDEYNSNGTTQLLQNKFTEFCVNNGLAHDFAVCLSFAIDSEENVDENYSGSYFYRLRG